tara:strand:+ start:426 stop:671 length:246 start_codon:yes stop_codon:yes gene_type:complete
MNASTEEAMRRVVRDELEQAVGPRSGWYSNRVVSRPVIGLGIGATLGVIAIVAVVVKSAKDVLKAAREEQKTEEYIKTLRQ